MGLFGIKTKKDKKIEQLQKELDFVKNQTFKPLVIHTDSVLPICITAQFVIPFEDEKIISEDTIRCCLSRNMVDKLGEYIEVTKEHNYCNGTTEYFARVFILQKKENNYG